MSGPPSQPPSAASRALRTRYDRLARRYDVVMAPAERLLVGRWRQRLWRRVRGTRVLEVGIGTGRNVAHHPASSRIVGIDLSPQMLSAAARRRSRLGSVVELLHADVERLPFADASFDAVVGSFVFCSVANPVAGLREVARVCRPGGQVVLLEHVLSPNPVLAALMRLANPLVVRLSGTNIHRRTADNVRAAGLELVADEDLALGIVHIFEARPALAAPDPSSAPMA